MKRLLQDCLNNLGIQIKRYPDLDIKRRIQLMNYFEINKILDVGANVGNYAMKIRKLGFSGDIISFEPLSQTFQKLQKNAKNDNSWKTINIALGNEDGETEINIAGNIDSSSILEMLPSHIKSAPETQYVSKEIIKVNKIDSIIEDYYKEGDNILLKIDTQGYELNVLKGCEKSISFIKGIQIEMSLVQLYEGSLLYKEMIEYIENLGYRLVSIENGFCDSKTGELLQFDGVFFRG